MTIHARYHEPLHGSGELVNARGTYPACTQDQVLAADGVDPNFAGQFGGTNHADWTGGGCFVTRLRKRQLDFSVISGFTGCRIEYCRWLNAF